MQPVICWVGPIRTSVVPHRLAPWPIVIYHPKNNYRAWIVTASLQARRMLFFLDIFSIRRGLEPDGMLC